MSALLQTRILDGKKTAEVCQADLKARIAALDPAKGLPKLVVVLVGDNAASQVYVNKKAKVARQLGMASDILTYPADATEAQVAEAIQRLNLDPAVHGILVQLPLPRHLDSQKLLNLIDPAKDVDGLHPYNLGRLLAGETLPAKPCTPAGMMTLLKAYDIPITGKHAVIVGRSNIVGKPMALLLLAENATVTICHSRTPNLVEMTRQADILVAAVGIPRLIGAEHVKPGAVVLDVGINRLENGQLVGDVDFDAVQGVASHVTPVPGGVGPMTIATLMQNTLALYEATQRC